MPVSSLCSRAMSAGPERLSVPTPRGAVPALLDRSPESSAALLDRSPQSGAALLDRSVRGGAALLVLAPGAGASAEHPSLAGLARELALRGLDVLRFDFPYRAAGRSRPDPMPVLLETWRAALAFAREELRPARLLAGGRSMGGRAASLLLAEEAVADGLALFAYPLHPAGRPESLRDAHLPRIAVPVLCLCGTRDALCRRDLMEGVAALLPGSFELVWLEGADHGFHVLKSSGRTDAGVLAEAADRTAAFAAALPGARRPG